jgi:hypothetical protein
MKQLANLVIALAFMLTLSLGLRHVFNYVRAAVTEGNIRGLVLWQYSWNDAVAEARTRHKPLLVEFARESSPSCLELAKKAWMRGDIVNATGDYVPVMVDIGAHPDLAKQYGIATVPSLAVIDATSQSIIRDGRDTSFSPDELLLWLNPNAPPKLNVTAPRFDQFDSQNSPFNSQKNLFDNQNSPYSP